jgi:hypothetical protein
VGSIDIDLVVDPDLVDADQYSTIVELLLSRGYSAEVNQPFQFQRTIRSPRDGQDYLIRVDFLTPKPLPGQGRSQGCLRHLRALRPLPRRPRRSGRSSQTLPG